MAFTNFSGSISNRFIFSGLCTYLLLFSLSFSSATSDIEILLSFGPGIEKSLVSDGKRFELGFFSLRNRTYLGTWFYGSKPQAIVWVANRDNPLSNRNGSFAIADGKLNVLESDNTSLWSSSNVEGSSRVRTAKLMDSGNLVLSDGDRVLWQSFDNPTDTFLPGMIMKEGLQLTSWTSVDDPSSGKFTFKKGDEMNQYIIFQNHIKIWKSYGVWENDDGIPPLVNNLLLSNFKSSVRNKPTRFDRQKHIDLNFSSPTIGGKPHQFDYNYTRLVMSFSGQIELLVWSKTSGLWDPVWFQPGDRCSLLKACGSFASCSSESWRRKCRCLPGFEPTSNDKWDSGDYSDGCKSKSELCTEGVEMKYLSLNVKLGKPDEEYDLEKNASCETDCRVTNCRCKAYSVTDATTRNNITCSLWMEELQNIREYADVGSDVFVLVALSDIEFTKRDCVVCGINIIPYPLSTGPNCGDPMYRNFSCDDSHGHASFDAAGVQYIVTNINPEENTFGILMNKSLCGVKEIENFLNLEQAYSFKEIRGCDSGSNPSPDEPEYVEIEIKWKPALEPICNSSKDCKVWPNTTCDSLSTDGVRRCFCNPPLEWNGIKCTIPALNLDQARHEAVAKQRHFAVSLVVPLAIAIFIASSCLAFYIYRKRSKGENRQDNRTSDWQNREIQLYDSEKRVKDFIASGEFGEDDRKAIDVPVFDLETILGATDNFSEANKIGRGGFGVVYKGQFPGGLEVAIKRLSKGSAQGVDEFKNEVLLIAKLQHRNLVRLLGYCVAGDETMLLYEYMPNKSLDSFIFDRTLCLILNWEARFNIILGLARGLLYLHEDSRLRVIHRDLKTSNVLLDEYMNPKISDFGLAKIFDGQQTEGATKRVVGTYGYMSPEYALDGFFSVKSDVFSFGVVVLEIVSGKRNTGFYQSEKALSLLGYAWKLWTNETPLEITDPVLRETCNPNEVIKCINVGLLCVQEDPVDRPTMSNVAFMLSSGCETASLPNPRQPAFVARRSSLSTAASSSSYKPDLDNEISLIEPR